MTTDMLTASMIGLGASFYLGMVLLLLVEPALSIAGFSLSVSLVVLVLLKAKPVARPKAVNR